MAALRVKQVSEKKGNFVSEPSGCSGKTTRAGHGREQPEEARVTPPLPYTWWICPSASAWSRRWVRGVPDDPGPSYFLLVPVNHAHTHTHPAPRHFSQGADDHRAASQPASPPLAPATRVTAAPTPPPQEPPSRGNVPRALFTLFLPFFTNSFPPPRFAETLPPPLAATRQAACQPCGCVSPKNPRLYFIF